MIEKLLKNSFDKYYEIPIEFWKTIAEKGLVKSYNKEEVIKEHDTSEKYLNFIIKGSCGILLWNKNNFVCTDIILENDFVCDYLSFLTNEPTPYEVITFEPSEIFQISRTNLISIADNNKFGDKFWRYANQVLYIEKNLQYLQVLKFTASETYKEIQKVQPEILNRIPQKYIASFLNITPQSLSRIRGITKS